MKHVLFLSVFFLSFFALNSESRGGNEMGNGGYGVRSNGSLYLLDLWERGLEEVAGREISIQTGALNGLRTVFSKKNVSDEVLVNLLWRIGNIQKKAPEIFTVLSGPREFLLRTTYKHRWSWSPRPLQGARDLSGIILADTQGVEFVPLADRRDLEIVIDKKSFDELIDDEHRAALILHEIHSAMISSLYVRSGKDETLYRNEIASKARRATAYIYSEEFENCSEEDFRNHYWRYFTDPSDAGFREPLGPAVPPLVVISANQPSFVRLQLKKIPYDLILEKSSADSLTGEELLNLPLNWCEQKYGTGWHFPDENILNDLYFQETLADKNSYFFLSSYYRPRNALSQVKDLDGVWVSKVPASHHRIKRFCINSKENDQFKECSDLPNDLSIACVKPSLSAGYKDLVPDLDFRARWKYIGFIELNSQQGNDVCASTLGGKWRVPTSQEFRSARDVDFNTYFSYLNLLMHEVAARDHFAVRNIHSGELEVVEGMKLMTQEELRHLYGKNRLIVAQQICMSVLSNKK